MNVLTSSPDIGLYINFSGKSRLHLHVVANNCYYSEIKVVKYWNLLQ